MCAFLFQYLLVFVPVANLVQDAGLSNGAIWLRIMTKVLWLVALVSSLISDLVEFYTES